ncbi:von willebrand factor [Colletotrichum truncatum]|uniref:von willebrand factor n=1 Tax=Colletotrichum truncatum TaxID=5467 RepID=A0ACC3Z9U7_COLTU|nr:von willebrand factor [Colletotrichum truncatum]KAF6795987.1 von willebrand factor [Colletotrichum truncatum]
MRPLYGTIPRLYAPLQNLTRQSVRPSLSQTAISTAVAATRTFGLNKNMSTSSASQSSFPSSSGPTAAKGTAAVEATSVDDHQMQTLSEESHQQHHPTKSTSPAPESATSSAPAASTSISRSSDSSQPQPQHPLALPPLPEAPTSGDSAGGKGEDAAAAPITLDLGGQAGAGASTRLDHLGPLVVHQDGTMSRISNWGEMTEIERQNTLRILGRRNQIRLASLRDGAGGESK